MSDVYCLKAHPVQNQTILALARKSTGESCIDELRKKGDPNDVLKMTVRSIVAIQTHGFAYATAHSLVRKISDNVFLFEFKARNTAWRMAAYIHDRHQCAVIPILLEPFKGHGGQSGKIPGKKIKALEDKASIAKQLIEEEMNGNHNGRQS